MPEAYPVMANPTQEIIERVERSRTTQGLPARVKDPATIAKVAALLTPVPKGGEAK